MKLRAALEYEKVRSNDDGLNKVVLHKDGKFYHAYEWSAWLIKTIVCTEEMQEDIQRRYITLACCCFPVLCHTFINCQVHADHAPHVSSEFLNLIIVWKKYFFDNQIAP